jgi:hypothetical protein
MVKVRLVPGPAAERGRGAGRQGRSAAVATRPAVLHARTQTADNVENSGATLETGTIARAESSQRGPRDAWACPPTAAAMVLKISVCQGAGAPVAHGHLAIRTAASFRLHVHLASASPVR